MELRWAFVNRVDSGFQQITQFCMCRDFLHDIVHAQYTNGSVAIYGMSFVAQETPLNLDKIRMALSFPDKKSKEYFLTNIPFLSNVEKNASLSPTVFYEDEKTGKLILEGDSFWCSNSVLVSLYTFLHRLMCYEKMQPKDGNDAKYLANLQVPLDKILKQLPSLGGTSSFHGWEKDASISRIHNNSGVQSIFGKAPYFQKDSGLYQEYVARGVFA
jgi:hypothetical protein